MWLKLFQYETYNQMINKRNESDKDRELALLYGMKIKNDNTLKNFHGLVQKWKSDQGFVFLKLLEEDNTKSKADDVKSAYKHLDSFKEFDLVILSVKPLDTKNAK